MPEVIFNIATVSRRRKMFMAVLKDLANQTVKCNRINVAMSYSFMDPKIEAFLQHNFESYKIKIRPNLKCENKMSKLDTSQDDAYFIHFDDDIIYPQDYVEKLIAGIEKYERKCVVGWHGIRFDKFPVTQYKKQKQMFQYFKDVPQDTRVHVIGTGCIGFYVGAMRKKGLTFAAINTNQNCLDGSFGRWCRDNEVPTMVLAHKAEWIKIYPDSQDAQALWKRSWRERYKTKLSFLNK